MKNVFFVLAFMLLGTFAFANTEEKTKTSDEVETSIVDNTIDFDTFTQMFDVSDLDADSITLDAIGGSFTHIDSCGNVWTVDYWGYSFYEVTQILFALDDSLCMLG